MRILYLTRESPFFPAGGIGTYIGYMARAMMAAGHEVFMLAWSDKPSELAPASTHPFKPEHVHVHHFRGYDAWRRFPVVGDDLVRTHDLELVIEFLAKEWKIDVIEASDYQAPALAFFEKFQASSGNESTLCVTYNHGFIEDFYEADQLRLSDAACIDTLGERQQCRISDLVVAPSICARDRIASYGIDKNVKVVREPYLFETHAKLHAATPDLTYFGRLSTSKGIDKAIHLANAVQPIFPLNTLKFIGRIIETPFRQHDMQEYVRSRLDSCLRDNLMFSGFMPREKALRWLSPGSLAPSLGSAETFSYACIETIDRGLLPIVRAGTPMAEFFPPDMQHHVLPATLGSTRSLQRIIEGQIDAASTIVERVQEHCRETLAPEVIAAKMGETYDAALSKKRSRISVAVRKQLTLDDVTVLIPAYAPGQEFCETIDSLLMQDAGLPKVIICNDGTPEDRCHWFAYAEAQLPDCTIVSQPNGRLLAARLTLIDACNTEAALFLDADDILTPEALARMIEAWNASPYPVDAAIPKRQNFGESAEPILRNLLGDHLHLLENDLRMTGIIRTDILREIGFDASRRNGEGDDWAFWLEFTGRGYRAATVPGLDFLYRFRHGSMSWPWSQGQHIGTQSMLREVVQSLAPANPAMVKQLARALYIVRSKAGQ